MSIFLEKYINISEHSFDLQSIFSAYQTSAFIDRMSLCVQISCRRIIFLMIEKMCVVSNLHSTYFFFLHWESSRNWLLSFICTFDTLVFFISEQTWLTICWNDIIEIDFYCLKWNDHKILSKSFTSLVNQLNEERLFTWAHVENWRVRKDNRHNQEI